MNNIVRPIRKELITDKNQFYLKHLSIVNVFLPEPLTSKEIEVLALFMFLEIEGNTFDKKKFGMHSRRIVMKKMNISPSGLSNYLDTLKKKKFINAGFDIHPFLYPRNNSEQSYVFKLTVNEA